MRIDSLGKLFLLYYVTVFLMLWYSEARMIWWVFLGICFVVYAALLLERVWPRKKHRVTRPKRSIAMTTSEIPALAEGDNKVSIQKELA